VAEVELEAEGEPELEAVAEEAELEPEAGAEVEPIAEGAEADEELAAGEAEEELALPGRLAVLEEEEQIPTFDGEPIKDSIGWVPVEPEEDYYSGWSEEEDEEEPEFEWVRDDIFEEEAPSQYRRSTGKKKPKKRPRPSREREEDIYGGSPNDRSGGRPRGGR
jgi:hypothetical protein